MPEEADGTLPVGDPLDEPDKPDDWRDVCDDPTDDPHGGNDDG